MDRRTFLAGTGAVLLAAPIAAEAQQEKTLPRIGFLVFTSSELRYRGFQQGLRELGYVEGQNIVIEFRSADGSLERLNDLARELVRLPVDAIVAGSTLGADASKRATSSVPIVMANVADPVESGLVSSLARPSGNITGLTTMGPELVGKRLELMREVIPRLRRAAVLWDEDAKHNAAMLNRTKAIAKSFGVEVRSLPVRPPFQRSIRRWRWRRSGGLTFSSPWMTLSSSATEHGS